MLKENTLAYHRPPPALPEALRSASGNSWPRTISGMATSSPRSGLRRSPSGVSRNSVREAIHALAERGLLESRHGDGTYVRVPDMEPLEERHS